MNIDFKKITFNDLEFLNRVRNDVAPKYLHDSRIFTYEETVQWFFEKKPDFWIIFLDGERIGYFRISKYSEINKNLYLGADLAPEYQGKGLAKKAYLKFLDYIFDAYSLHKINLEVLSTNIRAINLYKDLGFLKDGVKREDVLKEGKYVDSIIMSILKEDYEYSKY